MARSQIVRVVILLLICIAVMKADEPSDKPIAIPLDEIWAWKMPGTRDFLKDRDPTVARQIEEIRVVLSAQRTGASAPKGFAVAGTGLDALRHAHEILVEGRKPRDTFATDTEISVVFFSYQAGGYVQLDQVTQKGTEIVVQFNYVPHETADVTEHFALIPIPRLHPGTYQVNIELLPMEQRLIDMGFRTPDVHKRVSSSFSFTVE